MQPVLGLVEDDGVLGLEHVLGNLHTVQAELLVDLLADRRLAIVERG